MATVTIDLEEYNLLRKHNDEFEKIMKENIELKSSSKVIIRTVKHPNVFGDTRGVLDEGDISEEFVNFDDVREDVKSKISQEEKDTLNNTIRKYEYEFEKYVNKRKHLQEEFNKKLKDEQRAFNRRLSFPFGILNVAKKRLTNVSISLENKIVKHNEEIREINDIIEHEIERAILYIEEFIQP